MKTLSITISQTTQYQKLKSELEICEIGGLFIALYHNPKIPQLIINLLKNDEYLKNFFQFPLHIDETKISFPALFDYTFQLMGKQTNIFHILDIKENLSSQSTQEFLGYLQYSRERFKTKPYSLIFWITPEFEKELFYKAPDFHHWVFGTYDFTNINEEKLNSLTDFEKKEYFDFTKIDKYLKKVVWQYENWQTVKDNDQNFLLEPMARNNLSKYYVQSYFLDKENKRYLLYDFVDNFIDNPKQNFLTILGDFGTGKSSFLIYYFIILAKQYLGYRFSLDSLQKDENSDNQVPSNRVDLEGMRIPIFISLKDYQGKLNIEDFVVKEFYQKFKIELNYTIFQELALQGKFIFLIDGFDEMDSITDQQLTTENLKELTKLSFENILFLTTPNNPLPQANKIILTSRTHYFFTESQEEEIVNADQTILYRNYTLKNTYQLSRVKLEEFNDTQIKEFIQKHTENEIKTVQYLKIIKDTYDLRYLSTRPLLLDMIMKTITTLKKQENINSSSLYREYTNIWINRDDWRSQMTPDGKKYFMWNMAIKMFQLGGDFSIHYSKINPPQKEHLKKNYQPDQDYYKNEATTCTFLNRDEKGNYQFIHKSFMEYFITESFYFNLKKNNNQIIKYSSLNKEMQFFLKHIISLNKHELNRLNLSTFDLSYINLSDANLNYSNLKNANLTHTNLRNGNLRNANLTNTNLSYTNLSDAYLSYTNLRDGYLRNTNLSYANLRNVNLRNANLRNANLTNTNISDGYLRNANLTNANLKNVNLTNTNLRNINLTNTNLNNANFSDANLTNANLSDANISYANLTNANLTNANLTNANLTNANLRNANLTNTKLTNTNFRNANLSYANLSYTNLTNLNFSDANLSYADFTNTNLTNANLTDANLYNAYLTNANLSYVCLTNGYLSYAHLNDTNLSDANLSYANFTNTNLTNANLSYANLTNARNLTFSQIKSACFWDEAIYKEDDNYSKKPTLIDKLRIFCKTPNQKYIAEIRQDKSSDPKEKPDCSKWS